jgi:two-component system chemotaxis response regulator CheY
MLAMIVDDSRSLRLTLGLFLKDFGFDVIEAEDGEAALTELEAGARPDVAFVDWTMPGMDGLTFIRRCHEKPAYREMVMMMVTTKNTAPQVAEAFAAGAHEYVIKPFTKDGIADKLRTLGVFPDA